MREVFDGLKVRHKVLIVGIILVLVFMALGQVNRGPERNGRITSSSPPEAQLAAIESGTNRGSRSVIRLYATELDRLEQMCSESRMRIADIAVVTERMLREDNGVDLSLLGVLQAMNRALPDGAASLELSCAEFAAVIATVVGSP